MRLKRLVLPLKRPSWKADSADIFQMICLIAGAGTYEVLAPAFYIFLPSGKGSPAHCMLQAEHYSREPPCDLTALLCRIFPPRKRVHSHRKIHLLLPARNVHIHLWSLTRLLFSYCSPCPVPFFRNVFLSNGYSRSTFEACSSPVIY